MTEFYRAKSHYQSNQIAAGYDEERFQSLAGRLAHQGEADALAKSADRYFTHPGRILDLPCGTGRLLPVLRTRGHRILGGDISEEMLGIARRRYAGDEQVSFARVDAENIAYPDNHFDYLTSFRLMCHLPEDVRLRVAREMIRVTRKRLIINYHVTTPAPLYLFTRLFRSSLCSPYPVSLGQVKKELSQLPSVEILAIKKLTWYDRSSVLVILQKQQ